MSATMATHFDRCLGCMACVTACPSGVQYDRLIEATRPQVERNYRRPLRERALRAAIFGLFTHPGRLRALVPALVAYRRLLRRMWLPRPLRVAAQMAPDLRLSAMSARVPQVSRPPTTARARVGLLQGCVQRLFYSQVNQATINVLVAEGFEVHAPRLPRCCGALAMHAGEEESAIRLAKQTIEALGDFDYVVVNAAGCGSAMKEYLHLLGDEPGWSERARAFSDKVRDVSELLGEDEPRAPRHRVEMKVAYHDACHLAHAQGIREQPRKLLSDIPGLEVLEPREQEICCGSAGIYNLLQPTAADELGQRKVNNLLATGAAAIAAGNPGCALQIAAKLRADNRQMPVYHPVELLDMSIRGGRP